MRASVDPERKGRGPGPDLQEAHFKVTSECDKS